MLPFYKYHAESGTVMCRIVVIEQDDLQHYAEQGYEFIPAKDERTLELWVDPLTKEFHDTIPYSMPNRITTIIGEDLEVSIPNPAWVQRVGHLPVKTTTGKFTVEYNGMDRDDFRLVGSYFSPSVRVFWKSEEEVKTEAKAQIDAEAEAAREALQTAGAGQATTYLRKADAARAYLGGFPLSDAQMARLQDEATRLNMDLDAVANLIIENADAWEAQDAEIDRRRLEAKTAVEEATTGKAINEILNGLNWVV